MRPSLVPDRIEHVQEHRRVAETFGFQGWIWGAFFLLTAGLFVLPGKAPLPAAAWAFSAGSAAPGLALMAYEIWRRRRRVHLVRDGGNIAVYRQGRLDQTLAPDAITQVKAGLLLMLKVGIGLGACGAAFTALGLSELKGKADPIGTAMILSLGCACWASLLAAAWTRFFRIHLRVPREKGWLVEETVLITPDQGKELFP